LKTPQLSQFTANYRVHYRRSYGSAESQALLGDMLSRIAQLCESRGAAVIGHIKLLATLPEGGYFHGSVTSTRMSATVEAINVFPHEALSINLVVLVYGLEEEQIVRIVSEVWNELTDEGDEIIVHQKTDSPLPNQEEER